jgi:hypothetical protein
MKKKVLFTLMFFIAIGVLVASLARAYTYDGDFDPVNLFEYDPILVKQLSPNTALIAISAKEKREHQPKYAVVCAMRVPGGLIILAYAYFDDNGNFRHFMLQEGHYAETPLNDDIEDEAQLKKHLKDILNAFRKVSNA